MRFPLAVLALTFAVAHPATAADISMPLNDEEQRAFNELLDLATKAGGLSVARATVHFATKLETLRRHAAQPPADPPTSPK